MQIRYRITIVYSLIVTIILLLLCTSIYYFTSQNREQQFKERLVRKAKSTANLLLKYDLNEQLVVEINEGAPSSLFHKVIKIYDTHLKEVFSYHDPGAELPDLDPTLIQKLNNGRRNFFKVGEKDAVSIPYQADNQDFMVVALAYDIEKAVWMPKLRFILLVSLLVSITIVIMTGYLFSIRIVHSISNLTSRINRISSEKFSERLDMGSGKDELQQLAGTINNLLDRLQSSFDTQRRFIDNASHELSTPLASIGSQLDVALLRPRDEDEYRRVIRSVNDDVKRLNLLVRSLLEIAKLSGSAKGLELMPVRIDELLMRLPSEMKKINSRFEVRLEFSELPDSEDELILYCNEELIFSAIRNIVHNACKFSDNRTAVVRLSSRNGALVISIKDSGPGIAAEEQDRIFQPFFRSERTSLISGSGLGLPLAMQIIRLYGGSIEVISSQGVGTEFRVTLRPMKKKS